VNLINEQDCTRGFELMLTRFSRSSNWPRYIVQLPESPHRVAEPLIEQRHRHIRFRDPLSQPSTMLSCLRQAHRSMPGCSCCAGQDLDNTLDFHLATITGSSFPSSAREVRSVQAGLPWGSLASRLLFGLLLAGVLVRRAALLSWSTRRVGGGFVPGNPSFLKTSMATPSP